MAERLTRGQLGLACGITAAAGFVDGVGFIHLGGYFVSFMSGNSTRAAADLASGDLLGWVRALGLVLAFVFGVVLASLVSHRMESTTIQEATAIRPQLRAIWLSAAVLALAAVCGSLYLLGAGDGWWFAVAPLIALAMGAVNATFTRGGEVSVGLTYMTGALVKAAQHFAALLRGSPNTVWLRYAALWSAIAVGSAAGAVCYLTWDLWSLWIAVLGLLACAATIRLRRPGQA
ncbi:YoaK family protein [Nesterenkonia populi]|uniref:YoaK family protein n=1 Tax=Nesterenkonia populi TaxID=1591087 RepID=UPI001FE603B3|nr:YoaK family protein [Nesterenkonia populi]